MRLNTAVFFLLLGLSAHAADQKWELNVSRQANKIETLDWSSSGLSSVPAVSDDLLAVLRKDASTLKYNPSKYDHALIVVQDQTSKAFPDGGVAVLIGGERAEQLVVSPAPQRIALHSNGFFYLSYDTSSESIVLKSYSISEKISFDLKSGINPLHLKSGKTQVVFKEDVALVISNGRETRFSASGGRGPTTEKLKHVAPSTLELLKEINAENILDEVSQGNAVLGDWMLEEAKDIESRLLGEAGKKRLSLIVGNGTQPALINLIASRIASGEAKGFEGWSVFRIAPTQFGADGLVGGETAKVNERFEKLSNQKVLIVLENAHLLTLVGGDESTVDRRVTGAMTPFLASGKVLVVATTSRAGLSRLQQDPDFLTPFQAVSLEEPNAAQISEILSKRPGSQWPKEVLETLVDLSARHLPEAFHPLVEIEAMGLINEEVKKSANAIPTVELVRKWVAEKSRRPSLAGDALRKFATPEEFNPAMSQIIGAPRALDSVRSLLSQIAEEDRDLAVPDRKNQGLKIILLTGPSGTGKTFIVKELEKALIARNIKWPLTIINGNEYASEYSDWKLFGPPAGYRDSEKKYLYHWARENPEGLIFFDEFDKQHPKVAKAMMNVLDEGVIPLGLDNSSFRWRGIMFLAANFGSMGLDQDPDASAEERELADLVDQFTLYFTDDYQFQKPNLAKVKKYFSGLDGKIWAKPRDQREKDILIGRLGDVLKTEYSKFGRVLSNALLRRIGTVEVLVHWTKNEFTQLVDRNLQSRVAKFAKEAAADLEFTPRLREWLIDTTWGEGGRLAFTQGAGAFVDSPAWNKSIKDRLAVFANDPTNRAKRWTMDLTAEGKVNLVALAKEPK